MRTSSGVERLSFNRRMLAATIRRLFHPALALLAAGAGFPASGTAPSVTGDFACASIEFGFGQPLDYGGRPGLGTEFLVLDSQYQFTGGNYFEDLTESWADRQLMEHSVTEGSNRLYVNRPSIISNTFSENLNGTFTVSPRGRVDLASEDENCSLQASEDGSPLLHFSVEEEPDNVLAGGGLGVRKGTAMTPSDATGDWLLIGLECEFSDEGLPPFSWPLPPNSAGRLESFFCIRSDYNLNGVSSFSGTFAEDGFHRACTDDLVIITPAPGLDSVTETRFIPSHETDAGPESGTYTVAPNGAVQLVFGPDDSTAGYLAAEGNVMVCHDFEASPTNTWASGHLTLGVRKPTTFTAAQAIGHYQLVAMELINRGPTPDSSPTKEVFSGLVRIELRADGTFLIREDATDSRQWIGNDRGSEAGSTVARNHVELNVEQWIEFIRGTWSVTAGGVLTIQFQEEDEFISMDFQVSADGQAVIGSSAESSDQESFCELIFGIRIPPPPPGSATALQVTPVDPAMPPGFSCALSGEP